MSTMPRDFFDRPVLAVAGELLGKTIAYDAPGGRVAIRLTEVEAYDGPNDPGSHAYRGRTARNAVMFGEPGHLYVYFTYGMHYCANIVCGPVDQPSGILLRAGEVVGGIEIARGRRASATADRDLARGPARLATALGLGPEHNGADVCGEGPITLIDSAAEVGNPDPGRRVSPERAGAGGAPRTGPVVLTGPRVGLSGAADWPWRFWLAGEPSVSAYRPAKPRRPAVAPPASTR